LCSDRNRKVEGNKPQPSLADWDLCSDRN